MEEFIWKPITLIAYVGRYEINQFGDIRRLQSNHKYKRKEVVIIKKHLLPSGYLCSSLCNENGAKMYRVSRLVALHFVDNPNGYPQVNHIDGVKTNNYYKNLEWCTQSMNMLHAYSIGLEQLATGEKNAGSILKDNQVIDIRNRIRRLIKDVAVEFEVNYSTIADIVYYKTWKHI